MVKLETINDQSSRTSLTITASSSSSLDSNNSEAVANEDLSGVVVGAGHEEKLSFKTWLFNWISWRRRQQLLNQQIVAKVVVEQQDDRRAKAVGEKETLPWRWRAGEEAERGVVANGDLPREHPFQQKNGEHDHEVIKLISSDESLESSSGEDDVREETEWFVGDGTGIDLQPKKAAAVAGEDGGTLGNMQGEVLLQKHNSSRGGRLVGPFDGIIDRQVPGLLPRQRSRMCKREGLFPEFVKGKNIIVVFHELSMTGAPLAMLELASEMVRCGGKVSAVVLNKKGGLYKELLSRGVFVLRDKFSFSWKTAAKADLVIAGSAACNTWIGTMRFQCFYSTFLKNLYLLFLGLSWCTTFFSCSFLIITVFIWPFLPLF